MAGYNRLQGERVFCHQCSHEWNRVQGGLLCPNCDSEFAEVVCVLCLPEELDADKD
jgi:predicted amidophosphoribosyltransferase